MPEPAPTVRGRTAGSCWATGWPPCGATTLASSTSPPAGWSLITRVLTLNADTGDLGLDFMLPTNRVGVQAGDGYLSAAVWDEEYVKYYTLLIDLETGEQQRFEKS
jgi:hypothetical protein